MSYQNGYGAAFNPAFGGGFGGNGFGGGYAGGGYGSPGRGGRGRRDDRGGRGGRGRGRGGGGGGGDSRPPVPESSNARMRKMVVKFADEEASHPHRGDPFRSRSPHYESQTYVEQDFHPTEDPPRLAKVLRRQWREGSHGVMDGFRIGITQEPHKHSHYVSLLLALSYAPPRSAEGAEADNSKAGDKRKAEDDHGEPDCGAEVLEDISKAFSSWVEGRDWLNMRLCLQFYSLLPAAGLVSPFSLLELYRSMMAVLDEVGGGGDRAERVVRAVGEGLMRSGHILHAQFPDDVDSMIGSIDSSISNRRSSRSLNSPFSPILPDGEEPESHPDTLDDLLSALRQLQADGYEPPACLPRYAQDIPAPEGTELGAPFDLPPVSMPPELYDVDEDRWQVGEGQVGSIRLFADDVVLPPSTVNGWIQRSLVLDLVHIFEVNRKEAARLLLALPRYLALGTFKSASEGAPSSTISLESVIITTLLNAITLLPSSPCKEIYYGSVITELCKLSPNTVAPPVGRSVRKLYTMLGADGLDVEVTRRIAEWFSTHLSNFGFQWMWKEWVPDVELPASHPKKAFMRKLVDAEIRLAYHDRILDTLPEPMMSENEGIMPEGAPEPVWPYERKEHPLHAEAVALLKMYRSKTPAADIRTHLTSLPNSTSGSPPSLTPEIRRMAFEALLQLGSRSFSHFLNATERYSDVLRSLTPDPASRQILLAAVGSFWARSTQLRLIVVDKYLQYGILEGLDVVEWVFTPEEGLGGASAADGWTDGWKWEILRMCLGKHVGRVVGVRRRVKTAEREDEAARARRAAERLERGEGVGEGEAMDAEIEDDRQDRSKASRDAQTSLDIHTTTLEKLLLLTSRHFIASLLPWLPSSSALTATTTTSTSLAGRDEGLKAVLELLESGEDGWWSVRARLGWFREFVRLYAMHLASLKEVVERDAFGPADGAADGEEGEEGEARESGLVRLRAEAVVRGIWRAGAGES